jgi:nitrogen regulatory protein P-II 1
VAHLVVFVLDNLEQCSVVLEAWEEAGAPGVTILESTGLRRLRGAMRDDLPLVPSLRDLLASQELRHRTLFTIVADEAVVERIIAATEQVVGDFSLHHTGLLFVVPVTRVLGLEKQGPAG